jgi:hypothetical protein
MSIDQGEPREAEITFDSDKAKAKGEVFQHDEGDLFVKLTADQIAGRPELKGVISKGEEVVTVWVKVTDAVSKRLLQEGESLVAWVRVKQKADGKFVTKTALFSLGAVAAVTITRRVIQHYKPR